MASPPAFLSEFLENGRPQGRPYVTLTFAQSVDAKIAGKGGKQLILSGKESMIMTHWMRTMHDAILVGIGTALNDDPQLNTRHLPQREPELHSEHGRPYHLPRPIILDSRLRLPASCKLLANYRTGNGRRPWVVYAQPSELSQVDDISLRRRELEDAGAEVLAVPSAAGSLSIPDLLTLLHGRGIHSLMVEGGAAVIKSFFSHIVPDPHMCLVDSVIITIAPTFVGPDGVGYDVEPGKVSSLQYIKTENVGRDSVVFLKTS